MSLSLYLVVDPYELTLHSGDTLIAITRLPFTDKVSALHSALQPIAIPLGKELTVWDGVRSPIDVYNDLYGTALTYLQVWQILPCLKTVAVSQWCRAAIAFLEALPSDTKVVLYWC